MRVGVRRQSSFYVRQERAISETMLKYGGPGDSSYWNQTTWPQAQKLNADIYTILLGTNDAKYVLRCKGG